MAKPKVPPVPDVLRLPNGSVPTSIVDIANMPELTMCTMDIWVLGGQLRLTSATMRLEDGKLRLTFRSAKRRTDSEWADDPFTDFIHLIVEIGGLCMAHTDGAKLLCLVMVHKRQSGTPIRFALYPAHHPLGPDTEQVIGWEESGTPIWGTASW